MLKPKRYTCDTYCFQGVNGYLIYDNKLKGNKRAIAFSTQHAQIICDALNKTCKRKKKPKKTEIIYYAGQPFQRRHANKTR